MAECRLIKTDQNTFVPMDDSFNAVKAGQVIVCKFSFARNPKFHAKMFALFNFVHEALPEPEPINFKGHMVNPIRQLDTTRKELTVMSGYYNIESKVDGTVKLVAKSISFANMDNEEFKQLYSTIIDVALKVLPYEMTDDELDKAVEDLMRFA